MQPGGTGDAGEGEGVAADAAVGRVDQRSATCVGIFSDLFGGLLLVKELRVGPVAGEALGVTGQPVHRDGKIYPGPLGGLVGHFEVASEVQ